MEIEDEETESEEDEDIEKRKQVKKVVQISETFFLINCLIKRPRELRYLGEVYNPTIYLI